MARPASSHPTALELQILHILWKQAPCFVREIRDLLAHQGRDLAHTTVITTLNTMVSKKLLTCTKQGKSYLYQPRVAQQAVTGRLLNDVMARAFHGSAAAMILRIFDQSELDKDELRQLRSAIDQKLQDDK